MKKKILIACGGSGGHLIPGIALANAFNSEDCEVFLAISRKSIDLEIVKNYPFRFISLGFYLKKSIFSFLSFFTSCLDIFIFMRKHHFDAVVGMGGIFNLPILLVSSLLRKPIYLHDSNAIPGRVNRYFCRYFLYEKIFLAFEEASVFFEKSEVIGTPVRFQEDLLYTKGSLPENLTSSLPYSVLVLGGSQGAKVLNNLMIEVAFLLPDVHFFHLAGISDYQRVNSLAPKNCQVFPFYQKMEDIYQASDLVICRSGGSTLAELAFWQLPSLLIPFPYSKDKHQNKNAEIFVKAEASLVYQEDLLSAPVFSKQIYSLLQDSNHLQQMSFSAKSLSRKEVAIKISKIVLESFADD